MTRIYVFSGTGNGLYISKKIEEGLRSLGESCEILSIPKLMSEKKWKISGDRVGIVFPCYFGTFPQLVKTFIEQAESIESDYIFGVCSSGGGLGISMKALAESLDMRQRKLNYGQEIIIASNYMIGWYYNLILPKEEALPGLLEKADKRISMVVDSVFSNQQGVVRTKYLRRFLPVLLSPSRYVEDTRPWDSEFQIDSCCNGCGICERVCPMGNITITEKGHEFGHNCQQCLACVQYCPKSAFIINGVPMNKPKFTNPKIKVAEMMSFNR